MVVLWYDALRRLHVFSLFIAKPIRLETVREMQISDKNTYFFTENHLRLLLFVVGKQTSFFDSQVKGHFSQLTQLQISYYYE